MFTTTSSRRLTAILLASTALVSASAATAGNVTGQVTDASDTGATLRGAEVTLVELNHSQTADNNGQFRFSNIPAGTYTLRATYTGARTETRQITIPATGDISAHLSLTPEDGSATTVLVIGQRANLSSSISRQRSADGVQTTLSRDSIGQFPDQNVAESIRRAPGVNVLNDQGEGRFVSVRGLDPNLNSASINGNRILATGGDDRMVAMDVIPAELIESIDIKKSLTPDMDADTIGASVEINTVSAFDRKKELLSASLEGSYNDANGKTSPKAGLDFSKRLTDNLGVAGGLSYYKRQFATDNIEMSDWKLGDDDSVFAEELTYRDYDVQRERYGFALNFDYRVNENTSLYLRSMYSKFDDTELRKDLTYRLGDFDEVSGGEGTVLSFDSDDEDLEIRHGLKDRREWQTVSNVALGGKTYAEAWKFTYDLSYSEAAQREKGSIDPIRFAHEFDDDADNRLLLELDTTNLTRPNYRILSGADMFNDASQFELDAVERTTRENAQDKELSLRFDAARTFNLTQGTFELKFGGKARRRDKSLDMTYDIYDGYDGDFTLADVEGEQDYGLIDLGPVANLGKVRSFLAQGYDHFEKDSFETNLASTAEDYKGSEDINAAYIQGRYDNGALRIVGGLRVEQTKLSMSGNRITIAEEGAVIDGVELEEDTLFIAPVQFKKDYTDVLPSVTLRYNVTDRLVARVALSQSLMRPSFGKLAPRFSIEENDDNERKGEFGNPDLKPYKATNFDASLEYYFAREAVLQGGIFSKKVKNFIVDYETKTPGVYNGLAYDEAEFSINGEEADVFGIELAYSQAFTFLPAPWDGLLLSANYTYTDAEGDILYLDDDDQIASRSIPLPASARQTANLVIGYEKGPLSLRAAGAYRSGYLDELGELDDATTDRYIKDHFQLDLSAKYRLNDHVRLFGELVNANDATYTAYNNFGGRQRLLQYEEYSWTAKFGFKLNY